VFFFFNFFIFNFLNDNYSLKIAYIKNFFHRTNSFIVEQCKIFFLIILNFLYTHLFNCFLLTNHQLWCFPFEIVFRIVHSHKEICCINNIESINWLLWSYNLLSLFLLFCCCESCINSLWFRWQVLIVVIRKIVITCRVIYDIKICIIYN
jgi:hypothetical protein